MKKFNLVILFCLVLPLGLANTSLASVRKSSKSKDTSSLALKNYREIFAALAAATRVDPSLPEINNYYQQVITQLPRNGTLVEFNSQSLIASIGLAGAFCKRVIYQDAELKVPKSGLNVGIDFTKEPSKVADDMLKSVIQNYSMAFLQRAPSNTEQTFLMNLFRAQSATDNTSLGTRTAVLVVCTGIASSIEFLAN